MYVAITRAETSLFVTHAHSRYQWWQLKYNAPSKFLEELPIELVNAYDLTWSWWSNKFSWWSSFQEWDQVIHKLFGNWKIIELWDGVAVIKFANPKYNIRKIDTRFIEKVS